mgnify:CR=1 FL=1
MNTVRVGILTDEQRKTLLHDLDTLLPGTADQRLEFMNLADEALAEFGRDELPLMKQLWSQSEQGTRAGEALDGMASAGPALDTFGLAVESLKRRRPDRRKGTVARAADELTIDSLDAVLFHAGVTFDQADEALRVLQAISQAAAKIRGRVAGRLKGRRGGAEAMAVGRLVVAIAAAYGFVFREQPSAAAEGLFARALRKVMSVGGFHDEDVPSETRLSALLAAEHFAGEAPRRGRKVRR